MCQAKGTSRAKIGAQLTHEQERTRIQAAGDAGSCQALWILLRILALTLRVMRRAGRFPEEK